MKDSRLTHILLAAIFLALAGFLVQLRFLANRQQKQISYESQRDSTHDIRSDSLLNEIYMMAIKNSDINQAQDSAINHLRIGKADR